MPSITSLEFTASQTGVANLEDALSVNCAMDISKMKHHPYFSEVVVWQNLEGS
jgi:hypothetical protein